MTSTTTKTQHNNPLKLVRYASKNADVAATKRDAATRALFGATVYNGT